MYFLQQRKKLDFSQTLIQSMMEHVPRNGVPTFQQKERNGTLAKERNEERNIFPAFGGMRGTGDFWGILYKN